MHRIMFVCHGNICRSPMAELILGHMVRERKCVDSFVIASSATSTEEIWNGIGSPMYRPAVEVLESHGIKVLDRRAVQLKKSDYDKYDLFIGMDSANIRNMHRILGGDPEGKISRMMDYTHRGGDVSDPWYTRDFERAYGDIYDGCKGLLSKLIK